MMAYLRVGLLVVMPAVTACRRPLPAGPATPVLATPEPGDAYVGNLTGVAFGNGFARATADGAPSTDDRSSAGDQAINAAARADGNELARSCGNQGTQSHAQATAAFQPLSVASVRQFGFALSTSAYAKGGLWRGKLVICRGSHPTIAGADARATGRIDLTFTANENVSEQLILRVSGATPEEAQLEVRDGQDQLLPLNPVPDEGWVVATLARPGPYSVRASIASHAEDEGGGAVHDQHRTTFAVSVQGMHDALALGDGRGAASALTIPLPVFVSTEAMGAALDSALFTEQHRLYPCAKVACGTDRLRDVYLELPRVSTAGNAVVLEMRLSGSYQIALSLGGGVSGTIRATGVPVIEHDTLRFEAPSIDLASRNLIVKWRAPAFEQKLLDRIRSVRIDLTPRLQGAVARARDRFSVALGGACLLLAPTEAHVRSVQVVTTAPQGIVANFGIALSEASAATCTANATR